MKKLALFILLFLGIFTFSQSHTLVIINNTGYDAVGRLFAGSRTIPGGPLMFASPNLPYGTYTVPAGQTAKYTSFNTTADPFVMFPIATWNIVNNPNPAYNGAQAYNSPAVTSMTSLNEWAGFIFTLNDVAAATTIDSYQIGNPAIAANAGFQVNSDQTGANSGIYVQWFYVDTVLYLLIN
ncbi:hypothetical protein ACM39_11030 [Chryseobacterium sp. FH2]|uniref:hypothetical protein n=1 Tax=Chryseobacterium sp. FH2 TaxID=1674291 RepID=UPI00065AEE4A|nr:hypothetical protein [Chryseobacterium sp. FH2]KMQ67867.1 hypothetical protein ACM39_11030 [Chryseobacterium sp. FH2]